MGLRNATPDGPAAGAALLVHLGLMPYKAAWDLQVRLVDAKSRGVLEDDVFLILEHPPVFTLGRRGGKENLRVPEEFLASRGIDVVHIERGGDVTYHGPGQLVVYPILDLRRSRLGVKDFVSALEEVMIRTSADHGVTPERNDLNRGVWVGMKKLGSIGIAIRRKITFHGLALNINTDLDPFTWINPCGLMGVSMTSLKQERGSEVPMEEILRSAVLHVADIFHLQLEATGPEDFLSRLAASPP